MKMLINGRWVEAKGGQWIDVDNPATGEVIDRVPRGGKEDINAAVAAALKGFEVNRRIPARNRCAYLQRASQLLLDNIEELRSLMIRENGKSYEWADFEIKKSAEILTTLGDRAKDPQGSTYPMDAMDGCAGQMAMAYRQPRGVVGGIIPFNFPLEMLAYKVGGALAAGNAIVVKLSEDCPLTCLRAGELLLVAGVPAAAFHLVTGLGEETGQPLVEHADVPMITFTGSSEVGKTIMRLSASQLKHLSLELGGNDPVIVFEDAELETVAANIVRGRMTVGNGQACVADKRFIVHREVIDSLVTKCVAVVRKLKVGDPIDPSVDVGPVIHETSARRIETMINEAVADGATLHCGGRRVNRTFIEPTILGNVTPEMRIVREECFGPVAPFISFDTEKEALDIANDSRYGLQGAVYSRDISRALRVADALEVGGVVVNASSCFRPGNVPYMPRKESGIGTDNMYNSYDEMTAGKAIVINDAMGWFTDAK